MDKAAFYRIWAPDAAVWSPWVKPVLFLQMKPSPIAASQGGQTKLPIPQWMPDPSARTAVILDLPGARSVWTGVQLARNGYRPVPLFNSWPHFRSVLDLAPLQAAMAAATQALGAMRIADDAPPVFLLDADRMNGVPVPGSFDNRWIVFPQDFPSARFLRTQGIRDVLLVRTNGAIKNDLAHVLLRYQEEGLQILSAHPEDPGPAPLTVQKPAWYRSLIQRMISARPFRRNSAGGFGSVVPEPTSGGYG